MDEQSVWVYIHTRIEVATNCFLIIEVGYPYIVSERLQPSLYQIFYSNGMQSNLSNESRPHCSINWTVTAVSNMCLYSL